MSTACGAGKAEAARAFRSDGEQKAQTTGENGNQLKSRCGDFEAFLDNYAGMVYWLAFSVTEDNKDAEDVLQKTFLAAQSGFPYLKHNESPVMQLARTALNESFGKLRIRDAAKLLRLSLEAKADAAFAPQEVVEWDDNAEKRYTSEELRGIVREGIQSLTHFSRIVFLLCNVAKLGTQEVAELLHLPVSSIKSGLLRGRLQLREHLNKYFKPATDETTQTA